MLKKIILLTLVSFLILATEVKVHECRISQGATGRRALKRLKT